MIIVNSSCDLIKTEVYYKQDLVSCFEHLLWAGRQIMITRYSKFDVKRILGHTTNFQNKTILKNETSRTVLSS